MFILTTCKKSISSGPTDRMGCVGFAFYAHTRNTNLHRGTKKRQHIGLSLLVVWLFHLVHITSFFSTRVLQREQASSHVHHLHGSGARAFNDRTDRKYIKKQQKHNAT